MVNTSCLAGIQSDHVGMLESALRAAGLRAPFLARLDVTEIGKPEPDLVLCDVDRADVDKLEFVRRLRFVLPGSLIAIYTGVSEQTWAFACHLAGANCLLSKDSSETELASALRETLQSGCYTDPGFAAA